MKSHVVVVYLGLFMAIAVFIATANFNNNSSPAKLYALQRFLNDYDVDILLLQEVSITDFSTINNYSAYVNTGANQLGTAILSKPGIVIQSIEQLPSGRGISGRFNGHGFVNIYAPSGNNKRQERNLFFQNEVPYLLRSYKDSYVLGGDFNCVLRAEDCTGEFRPSHTLQHMISGLNLSDVWAVKRTSPGFTYESTNSAARLDRFYIPRTMENQIKRIDVEPIAFSDHYAVLLKLELCITIVRIGRSVWKMNTNCLQKKTVIDELRDYGMSGLTKKNRYHDIADWWEIFTKPRLKQ